jgi:hypothetical protein
LGQNCKGHSSFYLWDVSFKIRGNQGGLNAVRHWLGKKIMLSDSDRRQIVSYLPTRLTAILG